MRADGIRCVALDYGGVLDDRTVPRDSHGNYPVDASCVPPLRAMHACGIILVLSTNTAPGQHRRPALAAAGIIGLFRAVLASDCIGLAKPDPAFYALVTAAAGCAPRQVLHVGDKLETDVSGPSRCGMRASLVRPAGPAPGEQAALPPGTLLIRHVRELASLLAG